MSTSGWVDKVLGVVNVRMHIPVLVKVDISLPTVSNNGCSRQDKLLNDWKQCTFIARVSRTGCQEAVVSSTLVTSGECHIPSFMN